MYLALYRRFRPKTFDEVIGQNHIVNTLQNQIKTGKISHAYLFCGTRGTGKTTCAKIFARAINCENPKNGSPCLECETCKALSEQNNVDILEIDAASNNGVNEIRELREKIKYPPIHGKYKVYIIDEVHMLTDSAFNALLKTLEEPPEHAVFILATTEVYKLPATILSRCMRFDFRLVMKDQLVALLERVLKELNISCDKQSLETICLAAEGSVRDMLSIADCVVASCGNNITIDKTLDVLGASDKRAVFDLIGSIADGDINGVLTIINNMYLQGKNLTSLVKDLTENFKNLIVIKTCGEPQKILNIAQDDFEVLKKIADKVETNKLIVFMQKLGKVESELKYALSPRTLIELACLECTTFDDVKKN